MTSPTIGNISKLPLLAPGSVTTGSGAFSMGWRWSTVLVDGCLGRGLVASVNLTAREEEAQRYSKEM